MKKTGFWAGLFLCSAIFAGTIFGQTPQPTPRLQPFLSGLSSPLYMTHAKDGSRRIFVVQQRGIIKVVQPGSTTATDFMNISSKVSSSGSERGLLGLAFHPQFATNSFFFVNYTRQSDGATIIARYKAINNNSAGDPNSEVIVLTIAQDFSNHNGGMIEFRNDGGTDNLYIGMGDGGSGNDPNNRAQNINSLLGKFLRITPSLADPAPTPAYTNPPDNPYVGIAGADEIYAIGVRNPFRWSFDRANPSQLWAGDVGQNAIEEVDLITLGGNFGWRVYEGNSCTNVDPGLCIPTNYIPPIFQYNHTGGRCSITGGYVYRGGLNTFASGTYLYADYCSGEYWMWNGNQQILIQDTSRNISSFGEDQDGELYVVGLGGTVEKIVRPKASADFDGDAKTDISVFRPIADQSFWYIINSSNGSSTVRQFGSAGDIPTPEDYDGDGKTDIAVFRPSDGYWYFVRSGDNTTGTFNFGVDGDIPAAGDYDGDAKADFVVYRPSTGVWYRQNSSDNSFSAVQFGLSEDKPAPGDFDGDGKYDISVYRPSSGVWYRLNSTTGDFAALQFGIAEDIPTQGDFDGDGKTDQAVFRPSTNVWYVLRSSNNSFFAQQWGSAGDVPVVGDYDGDSREDIGVFRPSNGTWYIVRSSNSSFFGIQWGADGDLPAPRYDAP
jgi:glucose/arabinose dehydrogenase